VALGEQGDWKKMDILKIWFVTQDGITSVLLKKKPMRTIAQVIQVEYHRREWELHLANIQVGSLWKKRFFVSGLRRRDVKKKPPGQFSFSFIFPLISLFLPSPRPPLLDSNTALGPRPEHENNIRVYIHRQHYNGLYSGLRSEGYQEGRAHSHPAGM
jgi:hypothetical protein